MNEKIKQAILVSLIVLIAGFFRLYQLGDVPPSPDWDETALGYNAYSISKTGKDEYGTFLPLSIRSFDDYKPPLYTYLTVPSVALFGLSVWSTRLPSAVMGILAVVGVYFLVLVLPVQLNKNYNNYKDYKDSVALIALLSSFFLAISPWHIQFSRIAFEANSGITINIWAVTCFLAGLRKRGFLFLSAFLFGLGLYAYHSERIFLPLLVILLVVTWRKELLSKDKRRFVLGAVIVGFLTVLPIIPVLFDKTAVLRLKGTSSFSDQIGLLGRTIPKIEEDKKNHDIMGELLDNRRLVYAKTIASGYLSHFSLKWLFLTGDNPRHHAPDMGLLYIWELPFFLIGLYILARNKGKVCQFLFGWFLISPIAAAPTSGLPHAIRTLVFLPIFQIVTAVGIVFVRSKIIRQPTDQKSKMKQIVFYCFLTVIFCFALFNITYYCVQYFLIMNREYSQHWQYGYKEAVAYTELVKNKYKKVVVSTGLEQSYMFYLFYTQFDPVKYLEGGGTKSGSFAERGNAFDKYEFRPLHWQTEEFDGSILHVGSTSEIPHGNNAHITFLNGMSAIEIKDRKD